MSYPEPESHIVPCLRHAIATCVGCGCTDVSACVNELTGEPCGWLRLDRSAGEGVCTECPAFVAEWDARARPAKTVTLADMGAVRIVPETRADAVELGPLPSDRPDA